MDVEFDFKKQFYNLEGIHYKEQKKSFCTLLKSVDPNILAQHLDIVPRNYLERLFYVDVLIHAKQTDELLKVLKEGNGRLCSKILKEKWFFEEAFKDTDEGIIVNDVLSSFSYSIRMKVLKKLSLATNEERWDKIFDLVFEKYGLFIASQFLFACSPQKIINFLKNNELTLSVEQLKRILDKDSSLIKVYFEEYKRHSGTDFCDNDFMRYIVCKYPNLYFELKQFMNNVRALGRQTTKSLLKINQAEALKNLEIDQPLNMNAITRKVKDFNDIFSRQCFPVDMKMLNRYPWIGRLQKVLKNYPVKNRWDVFARGFKTFYKAEPTDHLQMIPSDLARTAPKDIKQKWAEIQLKESDSIEQIRLFTDAKKAFIVMKERLNVTSDIYARCNMLSILIEVCHANKDYSTYEAVLKYICARHRNEETHLRETVMSAIKTHLDYKLTIETFWSYVNEMIDIFRVKGENLPSENVAQYLIFLGKNELSLNECIVQYVKDMSRKRHSGWNFDNLDKESKIKGKVLRTVVEYLHIVENENKKRSMTGLLLRDIINFNKANKDSQIDLNECPVLVEFIKNSINKNEEFDEQDFLAIHQLLLYNYCRYGPVPLQVCDDNRLLAVIKILCSTEGDFLNRLGITLIDSIKQPRTSQFQENLLDYFFNDYLSKNWAYCQAVSALRHFITEEPQIIAKYIHKILPLEKKKSYLEYSSIKFYSNLDLERKIIEYFSPLIAPEIEYDSKVRLIEKLSEIMDTDEFIKLIAPYVPQNIKLDLRDEEQKKLYEAQCVIVKALKNLENVDKLVPLLNPFCQGDYLQSSIPLLYKVLYGVEEVSAFNVINILMERSVSTRKHASYLAFEILPQKPCLEMLNIIAIKETNVSAKKYLFQGILKYFLKNPSEHLLNLVISNMAFISKNDNELLDEVVESIRRVPVIYKPAFFENLWNLLDVIEQKDVNVTRYRLKLLSKVNSYEPARFKDELCQNIMTKYFLSENNTLLENGNELHCFVRNYLAAIPDESHFKFVFDIVGGYKQRYWAAGNKEKLGHLFDFYRVVCSEHTELDLKTLELFKTYWEKVFSLEETFLDNVFLTLAVLYKRFPEISAFVLQVNKVFQEILSVYSLVASDLLLETVKNFFSPSDFYNNKLFNKDKFALELLKVNLDDFSCFIAASIIGEHENKDQANYKQVVDILNTVDKPSVKIRYNLLKRNN